MEVSCREGKMSLAANAAFGVLLCALNKCVPIVLLSGEKNMNHRPDCFYAVVSFIIKVPWLSWVTGVVDVCAGPSVREMAP